MRGQPEEIVTETKRPSPPEVFEQGAPIDGVPQTLDRRLYFQLQAFTDGFSADEVVRAVRASGLETVVYADLNDPRGVGVLVMAEDPEIFAGAAREMFLRPPFTSLTPRPDFTMIGRTYSIGREADLEDWLLRKSKRNALNPAFPWAIWYPLRRTGAFNRLSRDEQGKMMIEHATIGMSYGEAGYAFDIRLECHGLDRDDNEFVLGLVSANLHRLSRLVKDMRRTRQTAEFMEKMGPFFVGRALWQSPMPPGASKRSG
jgi:chlorite dismutase